MDEKSIESKTNKIGLVKVSKNKDDKIVVRIGTELKEQFIKFVENKGATVSDYVRQMIMKELSRESTKVYVKPIKSVKRINTVIIDSDINLSKEISNLRQEMIALEYRLNEKLNKNKE